MCGCKQKETYHNLKRARQSSWCSVLHHSTAPFASPTTLMMTTWDHYNTRTSRLSWRNWELTQEVTSCADARRGGGMWGIYNSCCSKIVWIISRHWIEGIFLHRTRHTTTQTRFARNDTTQEKNVNIQQLLAYETKITGWQTINISIKSTRHKNGCKMNIHFGWTWWRVECVREFENRWLGK